MLLIKVHGVIHHFRNNVEEGTRESNWITVEEQFLTEGYYRVDKNAAVLDLMAELFIKSLLFNQR